MLDLTKGYDYAELIAEEKKHYSKIEITDRLTEGGIHAHDSWEYYWKRISRRIGASDFHSLDRYLEIHFNDIGRPFKMLSLASGYCGQEIMLAERLKMDYEIICTDINDALFEKARQVTEDKGLNISFETADLNFIEITPGAYDLIFAHATIHHVINLEHLMGQIAGGLRENGVFHLVEVVGKNRKLIWDENEELANQLLDRLPVEVTDGIRLNVPEEADGMEGIRQEDILPLLNEHFTPVYVCAHGAFMRFICTHGVLGKKLDPSRGVPRKCLDFLIDVDASAVRNGILRPLELWGVYRAKAD